MTTNRTCSLPNCQHEACYEIWGGSDHFTPKMVGYACAFDRVEVIERMGQRFPYVTCHDYDPEPEKQGTARYKID